MHRRQLRLESLEPRWLMSGNVTVRVAGQYPLYDLVIDGDGLANQIAIRYDQTQRTWTVAGIPGTGTTVNGQASVTVGGVTNSVWIDMGSGDDVVKLLAFQVPNQLHIDLDAGHDVVEAGLASTGNRVGGELWIEGDDGDDRVSIANLQAGGNTWVKLGTGHDTLAAWAMQVDASLRIDGDAGNDRVWLTDLAVANLYAWFGEGGDSFSALRVSALDRFFLSMGRGNDRASILQSAAADAEFIGGVGFDVLTLGGNRFGRLDVGYSWEVIQGVAEFVPPGRSEIHW